MATNILSNRKYLFGWLAVLLITLITHFAVSVKIVEFKISPDGIFRITDFLYHLLIIKAFWAGDIPSIYQLASQQTVMSGLFGSNLYAVMPIGVTPTALLIWLPFSLIAYVSLAWANTLWISLSLAVLGLAWWKIGVFTLRRKRRSLSFYIAVTVLFFFSVTMLAAVLLGQTSILACGLLIMLLHALIKAKKNSGVVSKKFIYVSVFLLSLKAPYLIIILMILFIFGLWYEAVVSALIVGSVALLLTVWLGPGLLADYSNQLSIYNIVDIPGYYASSIVFNTTNTFRSAFLPVLGKEIALSVSQFAFAGGCLGVALTSYLKQISPAWLLEPVKSVTKTQLVVALLGVFLLFLPYLGRYEELLLAVAVASVILSAQVKWTMDFKTALWLIGLALTLDHTLLSPDKPLWPFWLLKLIVLYTLYIKAGGASRRQNNARTFSG